MRTTLANANTNTHARIIPYHTIPSQDTTMTCRALPCHGMPCRPILYQCPCHAFHKCIYIYIYTHTHAYFCSVDSFSGFWRKPGNPTGSYERTEPPTSSSKAWMWRIILRTPAPIYKLAPCPKVPSPLPLGFESSKITGARL